MTADLAGRVAVTAASESAHGSGSTDGTGDFLHALRKPYALTALEQPNAGPGAARRRCIRIDLTHPAALTVGGARRSGRRSQSQLTGPGGVDVRD